jgi:hypothetical protein
MSLVPRLRRVVRLLKRFEPLRDDSDTLWLGPYFIPRAGHWWPTSFLRYGDRLFVEVELGTRRAQLVWDTVVGEATIEPRAFLGLTEPTDVRFWATLLEQVERRLRSALRNEGSFNARVARRLPLRSRTGNILQKHAWPKDQRSPLSEARLARLERAVRLGARAPALKRLSAAEYLRMASVALVAAFRDLRGHSPIAAYRRRADGRHGGMLDLPRADAEAFRRWFQARPARVGSGGGSGNAPERVAWPGTP